MASLTDVLGLIRQHESSGNYGLTPQQNYDYPRSHASGAYQFQPATWQGWTQRSGIGTQYAEAYQAPPNIQDAVAAYAAIHGPGVNSSQLWGGPQGGGYPQITNVDVNPTQMAQNVNAGNLQVGTGQAGAGSGQYQVLGPDGTPQGLQYGTDPTGLPPGYSVGPQVGLGTAGGGTAGGGGSGAAGGGAGALGGIAGAGQPGFLPPILSGGPAALGITTGLASGINNWITGAETAVGNAFKNAYTATLGSVQNLAIRFMLVIAAVVIIGIALWRLVLPETPLPRLAKA